METINYPINFTRLTTITRGIIVQKISGIYKITNLITGQFYIGSAAKSIKDRWHYHIRDLRANKHHSGKLQNSWNKYKEENFKFEVIEECSNILEREQYYMDTLKPFFNICPTAGNCSGRKFSDETKKKMSESAKAHGLNWGLLEAQKPKYIETETEKYCSKCKVYHDKSAFGKKPGNACKEWLTANRKSRAIPIEKNKTIKPIVIKNDNEIREFKSMTESIKQLSLIYPKINRHIVRLAIINNNLYYGYNWSYKNA